MIVSKLSELYNNNSRETCTCICQLCSSISAIMKVMANFIILIKLYVHLDWPDVGTGRK
jgi:hypothetical protein